MYQFCLEYKKGGKCKGETPPPPPGRCRVVAAPRKFRERKSSWEETGWGDIKLESTMYTPDFISGL